jgi:tetratricopeptide (TPR) repeat protein
MRYIITITLLVILLPVLAQVQNYELLKEYFDDAEYFFNREEYNEAAYYYKKLLEAFPDNANYNFKAGECYLNIPGEEVKAIPFLEKSIKSVVEKKKYRKRLFEENNAPLHAYYYLGNAYRINNQLDKALECYKTFIASPFYPGNYNDEIVENEIQSCERAKIIQDSPVSLTEIIFPDPVNTSAAEIHPVVSADEKTIIFIRRLKFYDAVLQCQLTDTGWSTPLNLNPLIGSDGDFYPACLSFDGNELYLVKNSPEGKDIYVSYYKDNTWTKAEKLGKSVNSKADETSASISEDGQFLYFASNRQGTKKGLDIYISKRNANNQWGKARNAGRIINTPFDEDNPCVTNKGQTLYFCSKGHFGMGGFDLFYTIHEGKKWSEPVNAGFPINTTANDNNMTVLSGGKVIYRSKINGSNNTSEDIFKVNIE